MTTYNDEISEYITEQFAAEDEVLQRVRAAIPLRGLPAINIKPEEGHFLQFLVRTNGAHKALEIGTLGGYSGIWIARGLVPGGRLITLEKEPAHATVAREHFELAGLSGRVEVMEGDAHELLPLLGSEAPFDFIFIDAEKPGYMAYFDWALENTRLGGTIAAHNAFQSGRIVEHAGEASDESAALMRDFNRRVAEEPRVLGTIYPGGDGMVVAVRVA